MLLWNVIASKEGGEYVLRAFHLTLKDMARSYCMGQICLKIESGDIENWSCVLSMLSDMYLTTASGEGAYIVFQSANFMEYSSFEGI